MVNISGKLSEMFSFQSDIADSYRELREEYRRQIGITGNNVRIESQDHGCYGIAQTIMDSYKGAMIYEYAVDRVVRLVGPNLQKPFEILQDCEFHYYALKLNVLAVLSGKRIDKLVIVDCYNGCKMIPVRCNPYMGNLFLTHLNAPSNEVMLEQLVRPREQHQLFA